MQNRYMDMTEPLRQTMAQNPFLKVLVVCGYYDMATLFGGAEYQLRAPRLRQDLHRPGVVHATTRAGT